MANGEEGRRGLRPTGEEHVGGSLLLLPPFPRELTEVKCGLELEVIVQLPIHGLGGATADAQLLSACRRSIPMPWRRRIALVAPLAPNLESCRS
uniref:Uncharacterized protein n=1 Tax=Oryza punctata TaxID=4537 RepID=A0A0E0LJR5_ORYPU